MISKSVSCVDEFLIYRLHIVPKNSRESPGNAIKNEIKVIESGKLKVGSANNIISYFCIQNITSISDF